MQKITYTVLYHDDNGTECATELKTYKNVLKFFRVHPEFKIIKILEKVDKTNETIKLLKNLNKNK